jgi:hypothetical protein
MQEGKRKLRDRHRRKQRPMARLCYQYLGGTVLTSQYPRRTLQTVAHSRLQRSTIGEPGLIPLAVRSQLSTSIDLSGPNILAAMTVDRDYQAAANLVMFHQEQRSMAF